MDCLSIVIVNYKTWDNLSLCLDSILKQSEIKIKVIVVDNNSRDNQISFFRKKYNWVHWVENSKIWRRICPCPSNPLPTS